MVTRLPTHRNLKKQASQFLWLISQGANAHKSTRVTSAETMLHEGDVRSVTFLNVRSICLIKTWATFTLLRFRFNRFLLMRTLPVHIVPFLNECTMKTIGVWHCSSKMVLSIPFQTMAFVSSCQECANCELECHCDE